MKKPEKKLEFKQYIPYRKQTPQDLSSDVIEIGFVLLLQPEAELWALLSWLC